MSLSRDRSFLATGLAHFAVDLLNSQRPLLLAVQSVPLGLSNFTIGLISTLYSLSGSLTQPVFGWLADRIGSRWVASIGVLWMVICFSLALTVPGYPGLIFLVAAALGSGAFHPAGTAEATQRGRDQLSHMETTATSIFFFFGQAGLFLGPLLGGPLIHRWGIGGLLVLPAFVALVGWNLAAHLRPSNADEEQAHPVAMIVGTPLITPTRLLPFLLLITFRSWTQMTMIAFLPKYLSDLGYSPSIYGPIAGMFMGGSALAGVAGAWLADRYGKKLITTSTLMLGVVPFFLFPMARTLAAFWILSFIGGGLIGASHSIIVLLAQRRMPRRMGAASGLVLGFTFAAGAIGTLISGVIADLYGFNSLFFLLAVLILIAAGMSLAIESG
ncbi:MAG: MFS transporter [Anaerolineales bacterium]|nr:MFS transporter [Anaerolineales bacterium]MCK5633643.1 MFS transporter [Anaerolineales bacterium]